MGSCAGPGRAFFSLSMASTSGPTGASGRALLPLALGAVLLACHTARPTQPPVTLGPYTAADDDAPGPLATTSPGVDPDADDELECTTDADCVITNFSDCCACCECAKPPYAVSHKTLHTLEARCATADCSMEGCNTRRCPPCTTPTITPACEDGACVAR